MRTWENKVEEVIQALSYQDWHRANHDKHGKRYKRLRPYSRSAEVQTLVEILGMHDRKEAESKAKSFMMLFRDQGLKID